MHSIPFNQTAVMINQIVRYPTSLMRLPSFFSLSAKGVVFGRRHRNEVTPTLTPTLTLKNWTNESTRFVALYYCEEQPTLFMLLLLYLEVIPWVSERIWIDSIVETRLKKGATRFFFEGR